LVERLTGFLALLAIGVAGLLMGALQGARSAQAVHLVLAAGGVLLSFVLGVMATRAVVYRLVERAPDNKWLRKAAALHRALDFYAQRERQPVLTAALALSLLFQGSQVVLNIALARVVGLDLPALTFWWLLPLLALASLVPLGIGGLGVREAAAVGLLHNTGTGADAGTIVAWSLLWQATVWLSSLPGVFLLRGAGGNGVGNKADSNEIPTVPSD
jgi:hypothetical protein